VVLDYDKVTSRGHIRPDDGSETLIMYYANIFTHLGSHQGIKEGKRVEFHVKPPKKGEEYREVTHVTGPGGGPLSPTMRFSLTGGRRGGIESGGTPGCERCKAATGTIAICPTCGFYRNDDDDVGSGGGNGGGGSRGAPYK
jgi:hypothetical protein